MAARTNVYSTLMPALGVFVLEACCELDTLHTKIVTKIYFATSAFILPTVFLLSYLPAASIVPF